MQCSAHILGLEELLLDEQLQARAIVHLQHAEIESPEWIPSLALHLYQEWRSQDKCLVLHHVHRARLQLPASIEDSEAERMDSSKWPPP